MSITSLRLSENLRAVIAHAGHKSQRSWSLARRIDPKVTDRVLSGSHSATLETLDKLAAAADIDVWQLLYPGLDPSNPPVAVMSETERRLYERLHKAASDLAQSQKPSPA